MLVVCRRGKMKVMEALEAKGKTSRQSLIMTGQQPGSSSSMCQRIRIRKTTERALATCHRPPVSPPFVVYMIMNCRACSSWQVAFRRTR